MSPEGGTAQAGRPPEQPVLVGWRQWLIPEVFVFATKQTKQTPACAAHKASACWTSLASFGPSALEEREQMGPSQEGVPSPRLL